MFKRKPGLTPDQFRDYYETRHAVLSTKLFPFFVDYRRNYIRHDLGPQRSSAEPNDRSLDFDVITEISFASRADFDRMVKLLSDPKVRTQVVEDESQFMDRSATLSYVVDENVSRLAG
jgi:hypothetical protein